MHPKSVIAGLSSKVFFLLVISLCARQAIGQQQARKSLVKPAPVYPEVAKRLNLEGTVRMEAIVAPDGQIKGTKVIGRHPVFVESALKALHDWKYEKASSETTVQLEFKFIHNTVKLSFNSSCEEVPCQEGIWRREKLEYSNVLLHSAWST
jgi:TonB family protein